MVVTSITVPLHPECNGCNYIHYMTNYMLSMRLMSWYTYMYCTFKLYVHVYRMRIYLYKQVYTMSVPCTDVFIHQDSSTVRLTRRLNQSLENLRLKRSPCRGGTCQPQPHCRLAGSRLHGSKNLAAQSVAGCRWRAPIHNRRNWSHHQASLHQTSSSSQLIPRGLLARL